MSFNSGRTGGTVRIITNEGTPQARELSFSLAAQSGKSVSINFTTPENGVLSITTILPDGRRVVDGKTLRLQGDTSEKRVATRNPDGTWTLEWKASTYSGPSVVDGGIMDNNFVLWKQQRIATGDLSVADPANYQRALLTYLEEGEAQNIAYGLGGQPTEQPSNAILQEALSWYNSALSVAGGIDEMIDAQGVAGRIVLGLLQKLRIENTSAREAIAIKAEAILGISATQLLAVDTQGTADAYARGMERVLAKNGFSFLLSGEALTASHGLRVETDTKAYAGGMMRIRWDVANDGKQIDHMGVYVIDDITGKTLHNLPLSGELRNRFFLDFPVNPIAKLGSPRVQIKVVAWFKDAQGNPTSEGRVYDMTEWLLVKEGNNTINKYLDLSVLPASEPNRDVENLILSQLATNAPISLAAGDWYVEMGSGAHDNDGFHALDINLSANTDRDKEVLAVAHGTISRLDLTYGTLIIDHDEQGDMPEWQSVYLHLPLYENGETTTDGKKIYVVKKQDGSTYPNLTLWEGKEINVGDVVGIIAGRGKQSSGNLADEDGNAISDTAFPIHLHYEAHVNGQAINMAKLIQDQEVGWKMEVWGNSAEKDRIDIRFVDTISTPGMNGAWLNTTSNLIFYRNSSTTNNSETDYFLAWEEGKTVEQMTKVVSKTLEYRNESGIMVTDNIWVSASSDDTRWDPITRKFVNRLTGLPL